MRRTGRATDDEEEGNDVELVEKKEVGVERNDL